ncbi:PTS sugar transporter subunit IIA [Vagococcus entomophilus]|uniref:PTS sugar transporter subunit IIA n=1 Tax=Vagococcus entomophilus TaxID=1160095 RepID=UPI001FE31647|nr:PTS sugar transporter subunit IIA [Vagococcus entomophilus]
MKKYVVASHGELAKGMQSTLELFLGTEPDIHYFSAYTQEEPDIEQEIEKFFSELNEEDQVVIFTDLYGGSVNQKLTLASQNHKNIFIISGFNIPLILEVILGTDLITDEWLEQMIEKGKNGMQRVQLKQAEENETSFFE